MNQGSVIAIAFLSSFTLATSVQAANPEHVRQLDMLGECVACDLSGADLTNAHLIGADLRHADLSGANLSGANLEGADLTGANLEGAILDSTYATDVSFNQANLNRVDFTAATIFNGDTRGALMEDLNLTNAQIYNTGIAIGGPEE
ncbi:MAG: pentapeptide repeat-containing protein [Cyanobacteria bacterium J06623_7]